MVGARGPRSRKAALSDSRSMGGASALVAEGVVEGPLGGRVVQALQDLQRLLRAVQAIHPGILPLDRDGALVADVAQRPEGGVPGHVAAAEGDEVPAAPWIAPGQVGAQAGVATGDADTDVLAVDVVDAIGEIGEEGDWSELLPDEVGGVPGMAAGEAVDRKSTRLNSSHVAISYAGFCLKK